MNVEIASCNIKLARGIKRFINTCIDSILKDDIFNFLPQSSKLSIVIVDNKKIKELNKIFRNINKSTNVLSFVLDDQTPYYYVWGEIIISYDKAALEARVENISIKERLAKLLIHSLLHLANFDHKNDKEEKKMKLYELKLLQKLKETVI